jgi:hypothetical protein
MTEQQLIQNWIAPHLVKMESAEIKAQQVLWGKMEKKILLIAKSNNIENDSTLIKKVIGLTQDFATDDFAFIQQQQSFSLMETNNFFGAEKILLFNFKPNECAIYFNGMSDEPMQLNGIEICFLPSLEKCVTDPVYKIRFAKIWLKMLNTKWIQK